MSGMHENSSQKKKKKASCETLRSSSLNSILQAEGLLAVLHRYCTNSYGTSSPVSAALIKKAELMTYRSKNKS